MRINCVFVADGNMKIQDAVYDSVFPSPSKVRKEGLPNMNLLEYLVPAVSDINPKEVPQWSSEQVTQFVAQTVQRLNSSQLEIFAEEVRKTVSNTICEYRN